MKILYVGNSWYPTLYGYMYVYVYGIKYTAHIVIITLCMV